MGRTFSLYGQVIRSMNSAMLVSQKSYDCVLVINKLVSTYASYKYCQIQNTVSSCA